MKHASLLVQPVQVGDELLGIFAIAWSRDAHAFSMDDLKLADGIAKQAAVAIELHRTQRHIIEQERLNAVGKMASGLAHDFNNALVPISGYAEMLLEHPDILQDLPKAAKYLKLIMIGRPPSIGLAPVRRSSRRLAPPCAMASSKALVGRRYATADQALSRAASTLPSWVPSIRCIITMLPPESRMMMAMLQLPFFASASAPTITFLACSSVMGAP